MRRHWGIGLVLVMAVASQAALAQEPLPWTGALPGDPNPAILSPEYVPGPGLAETPAPHRGPVKKCLGKCKDCLNKYGLCCWSHHNSLGCSSFEAEYRFIFGSCRTFYGEPCERRPTTPLGAGSPGAPSAYGSGAGGCACP